jgi:hypothetical protein
MFRKGVVKQSGLITIAGSAISPALLAARPSQGQCGGSTTKMVLQPVSNKATRVKNPHVLSLGYIVHMRVTGIGSVLIIWINPESPS